jgi:hypothetical protein
MVEEPDYSIAYCLAFAAVISFVLLYFAPLFLLPALTHLVPDGQAVGPLAMPIFVNSLFEAAVGVAVLTVLSLILVMAERLRAYPIWLPLAASLPMAWVLTLPSALEHGGPLAAWLVFGVMVAGIFCVHWILLSWSRGVWD